MVCWGSDLQAYSQIVRHWFFLIMFVMTLVTNSKSSLVPDLIDSSVLAKPNPTQPNATWSGTEGPLLFILVYRYSCPVIQSISLRSDLALA
jgi:hypothetical protein